jgi:hypothetical protein
VIQSEPVKGRQRRDGDRSRSGKRDEAMTEKKPTPDWERIERDYRAGVLSLRQLAEEHGITEGAIRKRAKRDGWERDLSGRIKAKADALVRKAAVRSEVRTNPATDREIVETNAQMQADVVLCHRRDIRRSRALVMSLLDELEHETGNRDLYEQLGELMLAPDDKGDKLNEIYRKVISLPGRTSTMKQLSESLKSLVWLERQAFGLKDDASGGIGGEGVPGAIEVRFVRTCGS